MKTATKRQDSIELQTLKANPGLMPILREGELIAVTLIEKANKAVYFSVPKVGTGVIYGTELRSAKDILKKLNIGDEVTAKVVIPENENGLIELSLMEAGKQKAWQELGAIKDSGEPITVKVTGANSGGLLIDARGIQGFLPASQLSNDHYPQNEDGDRSKIAEHLEKLVESELKAKIISINPRTNKLIFSEREVQSENIKDLLKDYSAGDDISGIISGVANFGAFVKFADNTDIEGMIHISELSHNVVDNPKEVVSVGDMVKAKIVEIKEGRVNLSLKALQPDPWESAEEKFQTGQTVKGSVYKLNPFGAFIKLDHELMGLIHVSEFGSVDQLKESLKPGDTHDFLVDSVKAADRRIVLKLSGSKKPTTPPQVEPKQEVDGEKPV